MTSYGILLEKSWNELKNNLEIFLPLLYGLLFLVSFALLVVIEILGFVPFWPKVQMHRYLIWSLAGILGIADLILMTYIAAAVEAMYLGVLKKIMMKKKIIWMDLWDARKLYNYTLFKLNWLQAGILLIPAIVLACISGLFYLLSHTVGIAFGLVFLGIYFIYFILMLVVLGFGLYFAKPILSENKNLGAIELLKESMAYTRINLSHVILTWLIMFGITLALSSALNIVIGILSPLMIVAMIFVFAILPLFILAAIILRLGVDALLKIFLFNCYYFKDLKKL
jgi:hypothetical protein